MPTATLTLLFRIVAQEQAEALPMRRRVGVDAHVAHDGPPLRMLMAHPQAIVVGDSIPRSPEGAPPKCQVRGRCVRKDLHDHLHWQLLHCPHSVGRFDAINQNARIYSSLL